MFYASEARLLNEMKHSRRPKKHEVHPTWNCTHISSSPGVVVHFRIGIDKERDGLLFGVL